MPWWGWLIAVLFVLLPAILMVSALGAALTIPIDDRVRALVTPGGR